MQATRQLLRAAGQSVAQGPVVQGPVVQKPVIVAWKAPKHFEPASKAPSPIPHIIMGTLVGLAFAGTYKMYYWNWKKELNQFNYDYNKTMAEMAELSEKAETTSGVSDKAATT